MLQDPRKVCTVDCRGALQDPRKVCTVDCRGAAPTTQGTDRHVVKEGQLASICGGLGYVWVEGGQ